MKRSSSHADAWWAHLAPLIAVVTLSVGLWRPSSLIPAHTVEGERIVADLATLLGSSQPEAAALEARLRSFSRFPPEAQASRALADGLIMCETARLDDVERLRLARQLYAITTLTDALPNALPGALAAVRQSMVTARCSPPAIDAVVRAARGVARRDPSPRPNWW
jgi:hypothetical protein